ncbi:MAG: cytochrome c oxidase subunit II [Acidimicrobiales bacterium]
MRREWLVVGAIWAALTALGEFVVTNWSMLPDGYSREAEVVNEAYVLLLVLAVPVFTFMVTMLGYSIVAFRSTGAADDGPNLRSNKRVVWTWLAVTAALDLAVLINPGFVGLRDIRGTQSADMAIQVVGQRWNWTVTYDNGATSTTEMVVPVDTRIRFDVTSTDVLHSFWVPGFGLKVDAVPGRTTQMYVTTERTGDNADDSRLRVQCAELCGLSHADMAMTVRVVEQAEYDAWVENLKNNPPAGAQQAAAAAPTADGGQSDQQASASDQEG